MEINIKITDNEMDASVKMESDFDGKSLPGETKLTASVVALLGIKMLFEAGDVWNAGLMGVKLIEDGQDPLETARKAREMREAEEAERAADA